MELRYETTSFSNSTIKVRENFYGGYPKGFAFKYFLGFFNDFLLFWVSNILGIWDYPCKLELKNNYCDHIASWTRLYFLSFFML